MENNDIPSITDSSYYPTFCYWHLNLFCLVQIFGRKTELTVSSLHFFCREMTSLHFLSLLHGITGLEIWISQRNARLFSQTTWMWKQDVFTALQNKKQNSPTKIINMYPWCKNFLLYKVLRIVSWYKHEE